MRRFITLLVAGLAFVFPATSGIAQTEAIQKKIDESLDKARLDDLIGKALKNNPDIRVAETKVREADAELNRIRLKVLSDVTQAQTEIEAAKAAVDAAQVRLTRTEALRKTKSISEAEYNVALADFSRAKATLAVQQAKLTYLLGQSATTGGVSTKLDEMIMKKFVVDARDTKTSDDEFLRRLSLDLMGRPLSAEETKKLLGMKDADRREKWLDFLLKSHSTTPQTALWDYSSSCMRCHTPAVRLWERTELLYHSAWFTKPATVKADSPMTDKLRKALDTTIVAKGDNLDQMMIMELIRSKAPGVNLHVRSKFPRGQQLTVQFNEPIPLGAFLQFVEDETGCVFILRDYGIVVIPEAEKLPSGAVRVTDFWKEGKTTETKTKAGEEKFPTPPLKEVHGKVVKVDAKDTKLVTVFIGADHGLHAGHTLEVFRLEPQPMYVGTIRILSVAPETGVGRLISGLAGGIRAGDQVTSRIPLEGGANK